MNIKLILCVLCVLCGDVSPPRGQVLDKGAMLARQTFWDNRDWEWFGRNIPFLETPDQAIDTTYYYRWELVTKHRTYGSPDAGYSFTEFIDRPFWSGRYGAISCPAGHQLYEVRWLRDPTYARDYLRYWVKTPGAQPRRYSTWLADAAWAVHRVHPDVEFATSLLAGLTANYEGWEREHFDAKAGLFAQSGHDDGMEFNINSRQTADILRGDWAYRPTLNSYLWADARAIAMIARLKGDEESAKTYDAKASAIKENLQSKLWDDERGFYFPMSARDEQRDGFTVKAGSLTYQTGKYAGDKHGRELIGLVPWQFGLPDPGRERAWRGVMDPEVFFADYGPTVTERHDPLFLVTNHCCWWSGQSWPYATSQTLAAMANLLNDYEQDVVTKADYVKLLKVYARTHQKGGKPYIAEGADPDTGSWEGYDSPRTQRPLLPFQLLRPHHLGPDRLEADRRRRSGRQPARPRYMGLLRARRRDAPRAPRLGRVGSGRLAVWDREGVASDRGRENGRLAPCARQAGVRPCTGRSPFAASGIELRGQQRLDPLPASARRRDRRGHVPREDDRRQRLVSCSTPQPLGRGRRFRIGHGRRGLRDFQADPLDRPLLPR